MIDYPLNPAEYVARSAIVTVTHARSGTVVRWYRTMSYAQLDRPVLSASRVGVMIHGNVYLHEIPREWLHAARDAHETLRLTNGERDLGNLATHRRTRLGRVESMGDGSAS
jgi:hypothetical protein